MTIGQDQYLPALHAILSDSRNRSKTGPAVEVQRRPAKDFFRVRGLSLPEVSSAGDFTSNRSVLLHNLRRRPETQSRSREKMRGLDFRSASRRRLPPRAQRCGR